MLADCATQSNSSSVVALGNSSEFKDLRVVHTTTQQLGGTVVSLTTPTDTAKRGRRIDVATDTMRPLSRDTRLRVRDDRQSQPREGNSRSRNHHRKKRPTTGS